MIFVTTFVFAQNNSNPAIKIYLEDSETSKNICDAKVTLEGFEIPAITGKYDKVGKFYYFTEIPKGYNTVMAYHKKYNEKGFQNIEGLPKEISLKLYTPYRVRIPRDSLNYYKEDNTKILIYFNHTILKAKSDCLGKDGELCFVKSYIKDNYPKLKLINSIDFYLDRNFFYFEKSKSKPFKRFNDPIIKKLVEDKNVLFTAGLLLQTKGKFHFEKEFEYFTNEGKPNYKTKYIKYLNFDTLDYVFINGRRTVNYPIINNQTGKIIVKKSKKVKKDYSDMYLSYKNKYERKLLKKDVYTLKKIELDSLYKVDLKIMKTIKLYNFQYEPDTLVNNFRSLPMPTMQPIENLPYKCISDILEYPDYYRSRKLVFHNLNDENGVADKYMYKYKVERKDAVEKIVKTSEKAIVFRIKNNNASPFGTIDLVEYYNLYGKKIYQNTFSNLSITKEFINP